MSKVFRRRISSWTVLAMTAAICLVIAGVFALNRPLPEYLVAKANLLPGEHLDKESFQLQRLDLSNLGGSYLQPADFREDFVVSELILSGELIPKKSLSTKRLQDFTTLVLESSLPVSELVKPGSWVQIWRTASSSIGFSGELLIERCQVQSVIQDESFGSEKRAWVEVLVSQEQASILLGTIAAELDIYLLVAS
ncbi:MAG: hypothetical protein RIR71_739 [Actinomycetota bacterium]